jgi:hypothetical protein
MTARKAAKLEELFDSLNTMYTRTSGLREELTASLAKKLSANDLGQLSVLFKTASPARTESDRAFDEVWGYLADRHWREPDTTTLELAAKHAAQLQERANAIIGFAIATTPATKDKDNE